MAGTTDGTRTVQVHQVSIRATPEAIWEAITRPEWAERYGYRTPVEYELRPGGTYKALASAEMKAMGSPDVAVEGTVIEVDPPRRLVQTWHPVWDAETSAEPVTRLTYEIEPGESGVTKLTVIHDVTDAPRVAAQVGGEIPGAGGGWSAQLGELRALLEAAGNSAAGSSAAGNGAVTPDGVQEAGR
ncbi:SRPBCC domain-containing protein [Planotetraspora phitsanulokensis]|uniref:Transcriptional regulator n=1 Tax=Planotetraspora phitsanulokensis TaxID=575192 RepID=A0A8J3U1H2_9ACTN|nr:SRPBCC domain-containing protein [Planotetraspora phitsanulokensis]GII36506.1 transcriptional regulator [Planotetraspora phitsanulokensis]